MVVTGDGQAECIGRAVTLEEGFRMSHMISTDGAHQGSGVMRSPGSWPDGPEQLWLNPPLESSSSGRASEQRLNSESTRWHSDAGTHIVVSLWVSCTHCSGLDPS